QRGHHHFAHLGVGLNEGMHLVVRELYDLARLADTKAHQRGATEDHADVTGELMRANTGDQEIAKSRRSDHLYLAGLHHKEWHVGLATLDQHVPARDWTNHSVRGNPRDLPRAQRRKHA